MKKILIFSVAVAAMLFTACEPKQPEEPAITLQGIKLAPSSVTLEEGESVKLHVKYTPDSAKATAPKVLWYSDKQRVASVNEEGLVTADRVGTAVITATCGKFEAKCTVEVTKLELPQPEPDPEINFSLSTELIEAPAKGGTFDITVTTDTTWKAACEKSWAHLSQTEGKGNATIQVTVDPADSESTLTQKITFFVGKGKYFVTIQRKGKIMAITIDQSQIDVPVTGGTYTVNVTSGNEEWDVKKVIPNYLSYDHVTVSKSGNTATIKVDINKTLTHTLFDYDNFYDDLSYDYCDVIFSDGDLETTLTIRQERPYIKVVDHGYGAFLYVKKRNEALPYLDGNYYKFSTEKFTIKSNIPWKFDGIEYLDGEQITSGNYNDGMRDFTSTLSPDHGKAGETSATATITVPANKSVNSNGDYYGYHYYGGCRFLVNGTGEWSNLVTEDYNKTHVATITFDFSE
ncbi:MAG: Ig-like domain-containing protein [Paludibacteraceae bacterium]|nr:Ig-like domain-containing protein [Paludibacteraceae bacterium]